MSNNQILFILIKNKYLHQNTSHTVFTRPDLFDTHIFPILANSYQQYTLMDQIRQ